MYSNYVIKVSMALVLVIFHLTYIIYIYISKSSIANIAVKLYDKVVLKSDTTDRKQIQIYIFSFRFRFISVVR